MDMKKIREMFPIFREKQGEQRLVYLDSAATCQRPQNVIDTINDFYSHRNASVHRGVYELSERATGEYEAAREKIRKFINAEDLSEVVFVTGTTEAINFVADAWGRDHVGSGDEIVVTQVEHHANFLPWQRLAKKNAAKVRFLKINQDDFLVDDPEDGLINSKTKIVSLVQVSNVLGNIWRDGQLEAIIKKAKSVGAKVMIDGAQSVPHQKIDVQKLGADFLAFSGHKILGPTGVGVLYINKESHSEVEPYQVGGAMIHDVSYEEANWAEAPAKFEAGTPPFAQVIGLAAAVDFFDKYVDFDELHKYEAKLCAQAMEGLSSIDGIRFLGNKSNLECRGHLITFVVDGVHAHDVAAMLGMRGVGVRAGHHCVQPFAKLINVEASTRASLYMYNDEQDVEIFVNELKDLIKTFKES